MTSPQSVIHVKGLYHQFEGRETTTVLDDIDLDVMAGEFLTIIGPSGCGKTTLLNIIAGMLKPSKCEELTVEGVPVDGPRPSSIALMFQESGLLYWRTARGNVELGLEIRGDPKSARARAAEKYLRMVGLEDARGKYPSQMSGGMKQRVALARALVMETPLLLMDEPFGALDEQTRILMSEELLRLCSDGKRTVLFVTHSLQEAAMLSDRIVILSSKPGRVIEVLAPSTKRPRSEEGIEKVRSEIWSVLRAESRKSEGTLSVK